jgi:ribosomal protein S27E
MARCKLCGKQLRDPRPGIHSAFGTEAITETLKTTRYVCAKCGLISCIDCVYDKAQWKPICPNCRLEMSEG